MLGNRRVFWLFFINGIVLFASSFFGASEFPPIVFVYLGQIIPDYHLETLKQTRLFNESAEIYLIGNKRALTAMQRKHREAIAPFHIHFINAEDLLQTPEHRSFLQLCRSPNYLTERFFYIDELMAQYNLKNVFYIESDVMIYVDLSEQLPIFQKHYLGMAFSLKNEGEGSVCFIYFANERSSQKFCHFVAEHAHVYGDMWLIAQYNHWTDNPEEIDLLPIISKEYIEDHALIDQVYEGVPENPYRFCNHIDEFQSFFDADFWGTYLIDNQKPSIPIVFDVDYLSMQWIRDSKGRKVPYAGYVRPGQNHQTYYRINNLHVVSNIRPRKCPDFFSSMNGESIHQRTRPAIRN